MSFFAILFALLLEQARPLPRNHPLRGGARAWTVSVRRTLDVGRSSHGWPAWLLAVLPPALLACGVYWLLLVKVGWLVALAWNVAVLYMTLGFRQFSHHFTAIRHALEEGDEHAARSALADWQQVDATDVPRSEVVRHVIEYSVISAHRHVFGVFFWFIVLALLGLGPAGAVLYRMAEYLSRHWLPQTAGVAAGTTAPVSVHLQQATRRAWHVVDWLPARATALGFAMVGSFEEAIDGWRFHASRFPNDNDGVILAATAGAVNVGLGGGALPRRAQAGFDAADDVASARADAPGTPGRVPQVAHLRSVVGLVWRLVVVWLLLALLTL